MQFRGLIVQQASTTSLSPLWSCTVALLHPPFRCPRWSAGKALRIACHDVYFRGNGRDARVLASAVSEGRHHRWHGTPSRQDPAAEMRLRNQSISGAVGACDFQAASRRKCPKAAEAIASGANLMTAPRSWDTRIASTAELRPLPTSFTYRWCIECRLDTTCLCRSEIGTSGGVRCPGDVSVLIVTSESPGHLFPTGEACWKDERCSAK